MGVQLIQVIKVTQVVQVVWVVQVVRMARTTSLDDMHSENIWFSWYKLSKYREKLICHACDGRTDGGRRKVENRAVFCWTRNRKNDFMTKLQLPNLHQTILVLHDNDRTRVR